MNIETTTIIVSLVAAAIAIYAIYKAQKAGTPITGELLTTTLQTSTNTAQELTEVALTAVRASEQLWRTGKIEKDERLNRAFAYTRKWFPELDQAQIITALESAVLVVNAIVDNMPSKATPPAPPVSGTFTGEVR